MKACGYGGCDRPSKARGLCNGHYEQQRRGQDLHPLPSRAVGDRFWSKVRKTDTCWLWVGAVNDAGYGQIHLARSTHYAHRLVLEMSGTEIPAGAQVDHRCLTPACVNPAHLRIVTNAQNSQHKRGAYSTSKSGVRSVWWSNKAGRWVVQVTKDGHRHWGGSFDLIEDAEAAAIALRCELFTHNDLDRVAS